MSLLKLVLSQSNQGFTITPQIQARFKAITELRKLLINNNKQIRFNFVKGSSSPQVTSVDVDKTSIKGKIDFSSGSYEYVFEATEGDDKKKSNFETNLKDVDIAIKHKTTGKVSHVTQLTVMSYAYGVRAILKLGDEGEYEILIGGDASQYKPKSTTPQKSSQKPYWLP